MFLLSGSRWAILITLGGSLAAQAQQPAAPAAASARPAASAAVPGDLSFRSALEGYRPFADEKPASWREANDNVRRIGGWREYAREAQGTPAAPASRGAEGGAAAPPPGGPHSGHKH
jgi:hypothetical protein